MHNETEGCGVIPFTDDQYGRKRKIVFTPNRVTVELVDAKPGLDPDVTSLLTHEEGHEVITKISAARARALRLTQPSDDDVPVGHSRVVVVTDAMVDACYNNPQKVSLPGKNLMRKTLERALRVSNVLVVDLPYLHLHARLAGDYLMKAKAFLGHRWLGSLDEALNHVDYVRNALGPHVSTEPAEPPPDYKKLFEDAVYHLRAVSGSRNSFTSDATDRLYNLDQPGISLRTPQVEAMQREAASWLKQHEYLIPQDQSKDEPEEEN